MSSQHAQGENRTLNVSRLYAVATTVTVVVSVLSAIFVVATHLIWNPVVPHANRVDAIVVTAYGQDRLRLGRELAQAGVSKNLVLSISDGIEQRIDDGTLKVLYPEEVKQGKNSGGPWIEKCGENYGKYVVECVVPAPHSTQGEALGVEEMAAERNWDSLMVVTERSHMGRAMQIFDSCTNRKVFGAMTDRRGPWHRDIRRTLYEIGASARFALFGRC